MIYLVLMWETEWQRSKILVAKVSQDFLLWNFDYERTNEQTFVIVESLSRLKMKIIKDDDSKLLRGICLQMGRLN